MRLKLFANIKKATEYHPITPEQLQLARDACTAIMTYMRDHKLRGFGIYIDKMTYDMPRVQVTVGDWDDEQAHEKEKFTYYAWKLKDEMKVDISPSASIHWGKDSVIVIQNAYHDTFR